MMEIVRGSRNKLCAAFFSLLIISHGWTVFAPDIAQADTESQVYGVTKPFWISEWAIVRFGTDGLVQDTLRVDTEVAYSSIVDDGNHLFAVGQELSNNRLTIHGMSTAGELFSVRVISNFSAGTSLFKGKRNSQGNLYVTGIQGICRIPLIGGTQCDIIPRSYFGVAADQFGFMYGSSNISDTLEVLDPQGMLIASVPTTFAQTGDVAIDETRRLVYVTSQFGEGVAVFDISQTIPQFVEILPTPEQPNAFGISIDSTNGNLLLYGSSLGAEYQPDGTFVKFYAQFSPFAGIMGMTGFFISEPSYTVMVCIATVIFWRTSTRKTVRGFN